jgi:hypothetical protein
VWVTIAIDAHRDDHRDRDGAPVSLGHHLKALSSDQANGGLYDRFCGKSMRLAVLQPKYIAGQVKRADLAAAIGEQLVTSYRPLCDLINVFGRLLLAVDLLPTPSAPLELSGHA